MDNRTLRAFIIKHKDIGMTYQEIADKLYSEYGISRSRQALQSMHRRALKDNELGNHKDKYMAVTDIVNIYCLGYSMMDVYRILTIKGMNITYNDVVTTIKEQEKYIKSVKESVSI